ncbi:MULTISPECIES: TadE/TadG family type IV pilus assembly protein [unclassified Mesorhizobium]|uniref:pilus assembly protein TadG-related protein n=1 Tax=unclassified Mesorhizobium TaxID=325217 RepID=UPI002484B554|nr:MULTISPECIES: TadE/TadG family type IV pilus assembly protein [unclassified Mesorhizobium]
MIRKFLHDRRGNYALMTAITMIPLMGGVALAVDYTELIRERQETLNALDAAGIATAQQIVAGATDAEAKAYAQTFFEANLRHVLPANTTLTVTLPNNNAGGGTLVLEAALKYQPYFLPAAVALLGGTPGQTNISFSAKSEIRLKNTLEVSLVLDNSGSMNDISVSNKVRFDLLKSAAKQLVDQLAGQAQLMKQVSKPVQFSLVPFAASVNVGPTYQGAAWLDPFGISPIQHENFNWATMTKALNANRWAEQVGGVWYARGSQWGTQQDQALTRFSVFDQMTRVTACSLKDLSGNCLPNATFTYGKVASWGGCVEARPYPYNINDAPATSATPATMFVPMFAPDEPGNQWTLSNGYVKTFGMINSWWDDKDATTSTGQAAQLARQKNMTKYFAPAPLNKAPLPAPIDGGPNYSCTTKAITPLTDVSNATGSTTVKNAIDAMVAVGATNVPEGMAWGWRTLSSTAPFTGGRPETEKGNDKVVIVLTDGANTYYTPSYFRANDYPLNRSSYSAYGYTGVGYSGTSTTRLYMNADANFDRTTYTETNYTKAMSEHLATLCDNAKVANIIVMTIALDLDSRNTAEAAQMAALKTCSSDSRFAKDPADPTGKTPKKLFWNSTGATLSDDFKAIGNELSNLRIVG